MAYSGYGTTANIQLMLGGTDTPFFTTTNIETAMGIGDIWVDIINSGASAEEKGAACDLIAFTIMKSGRIMNKLKGLSSDGGGQGRPARSASYKDLIPKEAYQILIGKKKRPSIKTQTPSDDGSW